MHGDAVLLKWLDCTRSVPWTWPGGSTCKTTTIGAIGDACDNDLKICDEKTVSCMSSKCTARVGEGQSCSGAACLTPFLCSFSDLKCKKPYTMDSGSTLNSWDCKLTSVYNTINRTCVVASSSCANYNQCIQGQYCDCTTLKCTGSTSYAESTQNSGVYAYTTCGIIANDGRGYDSDFINYVCSSAPSQTRNMSYMVFAVVSLLVLALINLF